MGYYFVKNTVISYSLYTDELNNSINVQVISLSTDNPQVNATASQ